MIISYLCNSIYLFILVINNSVKKCLLFILVLFSITFPSIRPLEKINIDTPQTVSLLVDSSAVHTISLYKEFRHTNFILGLNVGSVQSDLLLGAFFGYGIIPISHKKYNMEIYLFIDSPTLGSVYLKNVLTFKNIRIILSSTLYQSIHGWSRLYVMQENVFNYAGEFIYKTAFIYKKGRIFHGTFYLQISYNIRLRK